MTVGTVPTTVAALLLCALSLLVLPERPRLRPESRQETAPIEQGARRRAVVAVVAVTAAGLLAVPDWWWVVVIAAVGSGAVVARRPDTRSGPARAADRRLVAVYADLLASCLDAGLAVGPALRAVSGVLVDGGSRRLDDRGPMAILDSVIVMLSLGADADTAWRTADLDPYLAPLAAAARRSDAGGSRLADAAREHAAHLRNDDAATDLRAASRAGVVMTAPLGLCFLPAFLCLGLAPVVLGLLGQLDVF